MLRANTNIPIADAYSKPNSLSRHWTSIRSLELSFFVGIKLFGKGVEYVFLSCSVTVSMGRDGMNLLMINAAYRD